MSNDSRQTNKPVHCPACGAPLEKFSSCNQCSWPLPPKRQAPDESPVVAAQLAGQVQKPPPPRRSLQFTLISLMLIMTLAAVVFAAYSYEEGLGIWSAVLLTPALLYTIITAMHRRGQGNPMSVGQKLAMFLKGVGAVVGGLALGCVVLFFVCWLMIVLLSGH